METLKSQYEETFVKKTEEFVEYQKIILSRIAHLKEEFITEEVTDILQKHQFVMNREEFNTLSLTLEINERLVDVYFKGETSFQIPATPYDNPKSIEELKFQINHFKKYEKLLECMEKELPTIIKYLYEWRDQYLKKSIEYLDNLNFTIPVEVDWNKVKIDTPIYVRNKISDQWAKAHFAKYEEGKVCAWFGGCTSFSSEGKNDYYSWHYAKLAESKED